MSETEINQASAMSFEQRTTWRDRVRRKLFPVRHCFAPDAPCSWKDCVTIHTFVELSWLDRLRVLATGRLEVTTRTMTENEVGMSKTASECCPLPPKFLERK